PAVVGVCRGSSTGRMGDQRWQGRNKEKEGEEECWDQVSGLWGDQGSLCQAAPQVDRAYGRWAGGRHHVFRFGSVPSATILDCGLIKAACARKHPSKLVLTAVVAPRGITCSALFLYHRLPTWRIAAATSICHRATGGRLGFLTSNDFCSFFQ